MRSFLLTCVFFLMTATPAAAHFGMIIPGSNVATQDYRTTGLTLSFSHPFEGAGMVLEKPDQFYVVTKNNKIDLLSSLSSTTVMEKQGWKTNFKFKRPGVYQFVMQPVPYWEPEEDSFIIHYTKTMVAAFGEEEGWDIPMGLPTEIIPLTRPYGLYAGNMFNGIVLVNGKPAPNTTVEYELYNTEGYTAPTEHHITQVTKTDANGVFAVALPKSGWWGFAALTTADYTKPAPTKDGSKGEQKDVELGAVLWIKLDSFTK